MKIKEVVKAMGKFEQFKMLCQEYRKNPELGIKIFEMTKGHPCGCCNRPASCKTVIK